MGVDARMKVVLANKLTDEEITKLAWKLAGAFCKEHFFFYGSVKQCIERDEEEPENKLEIHLCGRYYGIGYERGDISTHCAIAEWLEFNIPGCSVLYGGDSNDELDFFGVTDRQAIKEHFFKVGHHPYVSYSFIKNKPIPECPHCKMLMIDYGGGGDKTYYYCYGCMEHAVVSFSKGIFRYNTDNLENREVFTVSNRLDKGELQYTTLK